MIHQTKMLAEQLVPGSRVVYGDSVAHYTPVIVREQGVLRVTSIQRLVGPLAEWTMCASSGKESCELEGVEVWSDGGWTAVERIIRHKAGKPMVRVRTHSGVVDVTTDHSLLRADGSAATPLEVNVGDALMHTAFPDIPPSPDAITCPALARSMGIDAADRHEGVPMSILGATGDIRRAFWTGIHDSDGLKQNSQCSAATIAILAASLGYAVSIDAPHIIQVGVEHRRAAHGIKKIHALYADPEAYVYDLTTANSHFAAGVGTLVVHNTDSVMVVLDVGEESRHDVHAHFEKATWLAQKISDTFPSPVELEFEKVSRVIRGFLGGRDHEIHMKHIHSRISGRVFGGGGGIQRQIETYSFAYVLGQDPRWKIFANSLGTTDPKFSSLRSATTLSCSSPRNGTRA